MQHKGPARRVWTLSGCGRNALRQSTPGADPRSRFTLPAKPARNRSCRCGAFGGFKQNRRLVMNDAMAAPAFVRREMSRTAAPTLLSAAERRRIVMVVGMDWSGTSLFLSVLGAVCVTMIASMELMG